MTTQKKFLTNFMVNDGMVGNAIIEKNKKKYDCMFLPLTNAALIDEAFAPEIERVGNFAFATVWKVMRKKLTCAGKKALIVRS